MLNLASCIWVAQLDRTRLERTKDRENNSSCDVSQEAGGKGFGWELKLYPARCLRGRPMWKVSREEGLPKSRYCISDCYFGYPTYALLLRNDSSACSCCHCRPRQQHRWPISRRAEQVLNRPPSPIQHSHMLWPPAATARGIILSKSPEHIRPVSSQGQPALGQPCLDVVETRGAV